MRYIPGTRGQSPASSPHHHNSSGISRHKHNQNYLFFTVSGCQSHGQTGALHWCDGRVQRISSAMLVSSGNAAAHLHHWKSQDSLHFPTDRRSAQWAETIWTQFGTVNQSINSFTEHFKYLAGRLVTSNGVISVNDLSINDYALQFRTLSAASGWNERSLLTTYRQGFEPGVRLQLSAYDDSYDLERSIQLSIRCASRMQFCFMESKILPVFHSFDTQWLSALQNQATKPWKLT